MKVIAAILLLSMVIFIGFTNSPVKRRGSISLEYIMAFADGDSEEDPPPPPFPPPGGQPIPQPDTIPPGTPIIYFDNN